MQKNPEWVYVGNVLFFSFKRKRKGVGRKKRKRRKGYWSRVGEHGGLSQRALSIPLAGWAAGQPPSHPLYFMRG